VRGRPKRNPRRRAERYPVEAQRRAKLALSFGVLFPLVVGNTVWRIKSRPV